MNRTLKMLSGNRYAEVIPLTFGRARLVIGGVEYMDDYYDDGW